MANFQSEKDFFENLDSKQEVTWNLAGLNNLTLYKILENLREARLNSNYDLWYWELINLHAYIDYKIKHKKETREKHKELRIKFENAREKYYKIVNKIQQYQKMYNKEISHISIPTEVFNDFMNYELFIRSVMEDFGMMNPLKEDRRF